ncbi:MAG: hypothetical protein KDF59_02140 [Nitrosomonas sp.]|nr:hypothetical protein [Nitrosomonas sp.]
MNNDKLDALIKRIASEHGIVPNALINAQQNHLSKNNDQPIDQSVQQISEKIRVAINHEVRELTRISRQAAIMNLLAAVLVLVSVVIVVFMLL